MIKLIGDKLPQKVYLALSGGPDSMAVLDFLLRGGKEVIALYFNHGTDHGDYAEEFVTGYCDERGVELYISHKNRERERGESPEEYWRNMRYDFFNRYTDAPIILCQHLNDQAEQYLFSAMNGNPDIMPCQSGNIIRPFMLNTKEELLDWCDRKDVPYVIDPSNADTRYMRNQIRHKIMPEVLKVNPGFLKVIKKKILAKYGK